jgi:tetratricopeptide (TPR) repeat protein
LAQASLHARGRAGMDAASELLLEHSRLIQHPIAPDAFEHLWYWAALAAATNANRTSVVTRLADAALERFPDEPRFVLARAIAQDLSDSDGLATAARDGRLTARLAESANDLMARYDEAIRFEATRVEATVRQALLLHRMGRDQDALDRLSASGDRAGDPFVTYLRHLFRGQTLDAMGRVDEAADAYRAALAYAPGAQSAQVGLMTCLIRLGDRAGAEALAEAIQQPSEVFDPWWAYWSGDYRFHAELLDRLRSEGR